MALHSQPFHPQHLQRRIWRALHCATPQEIRDGMDFYSGAHGICRLIAKMYGVDVEQVAGVYAALSPMNTWSTNVSNTMDVFRYGEASSVNTTHINHRKALRIAKGEEPLDVLRGKKVRAFYRGIADPSDLTPIPVDRHLLCLALGLDVRSNRALSKYTRSGKLYNRVESVYSYLGEREGVGNRLASIAWFVQRRIRSRQGPLVLHSDLVCCSGEVMLSHGRPRKDGTRRFRCGECGGTKTVRPPHLTTTSKYAEWLVHVGGGRNAGLGGGWELVSTPNGHDPAYPVSRDDRGRGLVYCGVTHPWANSGGVQWLHRFLVMEALGRRLLSSEHVDHRDRDRTNDRLENYRVLLADDHNAYHRAGGSGRHLPVLAEWVEGEGFVEYDLEVEYGAEDVLEGRSGQGGQGEESVVDWADFDRYEAEQGEG